MSNSIEIEAKVLLSKQDYETLIALYAEAPKYSQTNYYIDTVDRRLQSHKASLRIRHKNNDYELTLKTKLDEGLLERNETITTKDFEAFQKERLFPNGEIKRFIEALGINIEDLLVLTSLTTERIDIVYRNGLLSIDKNTYSGKIDYEAEFEYKNLKGAQDILKSFLEEHGVKVSFNSVSKTRRALEAIEK